MRYGIADPAFRFHQRFVEPSTSMLERYPAEHVWRSSVAPFVDAYMGHEFERIATQAYDRRCTGLGLPLVEQWGRWEGLDRARRWLEIDIVARLASGGIMTGAVKWNQTPVDTRVHHDHLDMLQRAADAGRAWAHHALESGAPILYVAAGGFSDDFKAVAEASGYRVVCWSLEELYAG